MLTPQFPAVLKLSDDDVLCYLQTSRQLQDELQAHYHIDQALLIDSTGQAYLVTVSATNDLMYQASPDISLAEFNQLVRNHLSALQQCCVLKISIETYAQGFQLIQNTTEQ